MNILKTPEGYIYSNRALLALFIPLLIEYGLEFFVGLADSIMVASLGEAAISGVSLVDFLVQLLIFSFSALATGGAVVAGRFIKQKLGLGGDEHKISIDNMRACYQAVLGLSVEQRVEKFAISRNRADIIPSAFASIIELMEFLKIDELIHTLCNIRYGVILSS